MRCLPDRREVHETSSAGDNSLLMQSVGYTSIALFYVWILLLALTRRGASVEGPYQHIDFSGRNCSEWAAAAISYVLARISVHFERPLLDMRLTIRSHRSVSRRRL